MPEYITYRNIEYRLLPGSESTANELLSIWDACRFAWNEVKAAQELLYEHACGRKIEAPTFFNFGKAFSELRKQTPWLQDKSSHIVRHSLNYLAEAYKAFFQGDAGYPRWKSRYGTPSFTIPYDVKIKDDKLYVPKVGWLAIRRKGGNPYPDGEPVQVVVRRVARRWYATVCYKVALTQPADDGKAVGVDMNVRQIADSTGEIYRSPDLAVLEARHKRHQRSLARKRKGSRRREKQRWRAARAARRLANARKNWQHHVSKRVAGKAHTVVIEDLKTKNMTRSAKGTKDNPGKNVRAKAGLNREIRKTGWSSLRQKIEYKAGSVIAVNPAYTSQTCSECGVVDADSRRTQASFVCVVCGHAQNADLNAACNILASGTGASARRGAFALATPATREMDTGVSRH